MASQHVLIEKIFPAAQARVFALFADHERFGRLLGIPAKRVKSGTDPSAPNGVGSTRRLVGIPGLAFDETVTRYIPDELIEYTNSRGGPVKNHHGRMAFSSTHDGGTRLVYSIDFDPKLPFTGAACSQVLKRALTRAANKVMDHI